MIYNSKQVPATTFLKSYLYLSIHTKNGFSAGGTVWSGTYRARASIMAPGGRDLGDF